nr:MAG: hypothetical protein [Microviridae sp.]
MILIIRSQAFKPKGKAEYNSGKSETSPNAGLTIREMVQRYANGEVLDEKPHYYDDDPDNLIPQATDLSDITAAVEEGKQAINQLNEKKKLAFLKKEAKAQASAKAREAIAESEQAERSEAGEQSDLASEAAASKRAKKPAKKDSSE